MLEVAVIWTGIRFILSDFFSEIVDSEFRGRNGEFSLEAQQGFEVLAST